MPSLLDVNSPMYTAWAARNPNSMLGLALLASKLKGGSGSGGPNPDVAGSNNEGGLAPSVTAAPAGYGRPSRGNFSFGNSAQQGIYTDGPGNSPMNSMPQYEAPNTGNNNGSMFGGSIVSFAAGGMMTPGGGAIRPGNGMMPSGDVQLGAASPAPMDNAQIEQEAQRFVQQHPEEVQKIQQVIAVAMQTGELTAEELNMAVQLAKTALATPASYPQIRQFAIKNGMGTEQDIPEQMDQGLLYVLVVAGKSMQNGAPPQGNTQGQGSAPTQNGVIASYKDGGMTGDTPHIAKLHAREYVVPEDALIYHGKKHFDKLVEQARTPPDAKSN